jgi:hypothetical protein
MPQGPLVPDAAFTTGPRKIRRHRHAVAHDQGAHPFKMLAFDGEHHARLPIIRTPWITAPRSTSRQGVADPQNVFRDSRRRQLAAGVRRLRRFLDAK